MVFFVDLFFVNTRSTIYILSLIIKKISFVIYIFKIFSFMTYTLLYAFEPFAKALFPLRLMHLHNMVFKCINGFFCRRKSFFFLDIRVVRQDMWQQALSWWSLLFVFLILRKTNTWFFRQTHGYVAFRIDHSTIL